MDTNSTHRTGGSEDSPLLIAVHAGIPAVLALLFVALLIII
jgi:hypothetical protein